jgi:MFS family permease
MKTTKEKIEEIKTNGYQLDFGNVFNHAFENYKKIALYAGLMIFVFSVLIGILIAGIVIFTFGFSMLNEKLLDNLKPENLSGLYLLIYVVSAVLLSCLLSPFLAGLIKMAHCGEKDEEFHVSTILEYYKAPYFKELIIATLLISAFSSGLSTLIDYSGIKIVGSLIAMTVSFLTFLTIPLIIFGDLKAFDAIKSSVIIVSKQPLALLGLIIVAGIASIVGLIGCCIGIFFTIPFMYSMYYAIYIAIIGIDSESEFE